jgi:DivIVA domain-containing protein
MSATHLDLPVLMSADQIRRREFVAARRGYDPRQVRDFLEHVADQVQQLEAMLREARLEAGAGMRAARGSRADPYDELARRLATLLRAADEEAERIRREAREEAERMLAEARADADRIRTDAQSRAEEIRAEAEAALREAREQADRTLAGLATKRDELVEQLAAMQERLVGVARELESTISSRVAAAEGARPPAEHPREGGAEDAPWAEQEGRTIVLGEASAEPEGDDPDDLGTDARAVLLDAAFDDPWAEAGPLEAPEIPPLDLDWGELPEDG